MSRGTADGWGFNGGNGGSDIADRPVYGSTVPAIFRDAVPGEGWA